MDTVIFITCYNFSGSKHRAKALCKTLTSLGRDIDIILVYHGQKITETIRPASENIQIIEISQAGVLWQKERFYNIALAHIKEQHKYVVWLDADVVFTDDMWKNQLKEKLEDFNLVQLFSNVEDRRLQNNTLLPTQRIRKSVAAFIENGTLTTDYFRKSGVSLKMGCSPGFAWGLKARTIKHMGFPDFFLLGSGDKAILAAGLGYHADYSAALRLNPDLRQRYINWAEKARHVIQGKISYLDNSIYHLLQGDYANRGYADRYQLIQDHEFRIENYLYVNSAGAWQWRNDGNKYAIRIREYFAQRED